MRTTMDLNDELLRAAKRRAADEGISLKALVERSLRTLLGRGGVAPGAYRLRLKKQRGKVRPGVDLADRDALFEVMEGRR